MGFLSVLSYSMPPLSTFICIYYFNESHHLPLLPLFFVFHVYNSPYQNKKRQVTGPLLSSLHDIAPARWLQIEKTAGVENDQPWV